MRHATRTDTEAIPVIDADDSYPDFGLRDDAAAAMGLPSWTAGTRDQGGLVRWVSGVTEAPTDELAVATRPIPRVDARCDYCNLRLGVALDEDAMEFEGKLYHRRPCLGHVRLNHYKLVSKELRPWS